ncbi:hypothetical protein EDB86DRAFT_1363784 [Lactarius hatsudake]|nr:hypothetical protein EDB86DRAFT_1363784 [Lactarius hatsudake]
MLMRVRQSLPWSLEALIAHVFVSGESTGHRFNRWAYNRLKLRDGSVTRTFLGENFGTHRGQCPRLNTLIYEETSLLRNDIKIEDRPRPKATVGSIGHKVHWHCPVLGLPKEM